MRLSAQVKNYLLETFMIGEETAQNVTPSEASTQMRSLHNEDCAQVFDKGEWLTA